MAIKNIHQIIFITFVVLLQFVRKSAPNYHKIAGQPKIQLKNGLNVFGRVNQTSYQNKTYYSFRAIPYAEPPINDLRFKPPVPLPADLSHQIINSSTDPCSCLQLLVSWGGCEDCLYLNVYTPKSELTSLLPVMVWIPGGGFIIGNNSYSIYGPDYLLTQDVIIVTINYRLGVFGFLSTEDYASPGNYGLKDQLLALQWVRDNIIYFGGNPDRVTIFGQSAGGMCASYLSLSPLAKGLFKGIIMQSGTSIHPVAFTTNAKAVSYNIGAILNVNRTTSKTLVEGLRKIDYKILQKVQLRVNVKDAIFGNLLNSFPFAPTLEPPNPDAIVTRASFERIKYGYFHSGPIMLGYNSLEGINLKPLVHYFRLFLLKYDLMPSELVPGSLNIYYAKTKKKVNYKIKCYHFGIVPIIISTTTRIIQFFSDTFFVRSVLAAAMLYSRHVPTYLYKFSYLGSGHIHQKGVGHSEELEYLWKMENDPNEPTYEDQMTTKRIVKMWTNFAKYGNPTPFEDHVLQYVKWPLANVTQKFELNYLDFGKQLIVSKNPNWDSFIFWVNLFEDYGNRPFTTY